MRRIFIDDKLTTNVGKFLVDQFFRYLFLRFVSPLLSVNLSCWVCVVLQTKQRLASPVFVKFVKLQVIRYQDLRFFAILKSFFFFENFFFGLSLHLQVLIVASFLYRIGAKFCLASVYSIKCSFFSPVTKYL